MNAATSAPAMAMLDTREVTNDDVVAETASEFWALLHHGEVQEELDIGKKRHVVCQPLISRSTDAMTGRLTS